MRDLHKAGGSVYSPASQHRISFVVTSRNDDHGRSMLRRFEIFANALLDQANRHGLTGELIVVEWNPPPGPRLHDVLELHHKSDSFSIRFIEVPPEAHQTIRNSDVMPLFQMIAKNVGIRRARGEFVVLTNPDVLFSEALIEFLARGDVRTDTMYRIDRTDVGADVPAAASTAEQLAWCQRHVLRIHGRGGTREMAREGLWRRLRRRGEAPLKRLAGWRAWQVRRTVRKLRRLLTGQRCPVSLRRLAGWRPWQGRRTVRRLWRLLKEQSRRAHSVAYTLLPGTVKKALARAHLLYGARRKLRNAIWLGLNYLCGPPRVHTNGCGDFTLLARARWLELRGYPELPLWSMHLDSFLCYMAVASGLRERVLRPPCAMFHIEHGNSWASMTPEDRLRTFALKPWIDISLLGDLWAEAYRTGRPVQFNDERWGLADRDLQEVILLSGEKRRANQDPDRTGWRRDDER